MSNALMEAVAAGVPCVATDVGGNAGVLGGLHALAAPSDVAALADAVAGVLDTYERAMGEALLRRSQVRAEWAIDALAERHAQLYARLLAQVQVHPKGNARRQEEQA